MNKILYVMPNGTGPRRAPFHSALFELVLPRMVSEEVDHSIPEIFSILFDEPTISCIVQFPSIRELRLREFDLSNAG